MPSIDVGCLINKLLETKVKEELCWSVFFLLYIYIYPNKYKLNKSELELREHPSTRCVNKPILSNPTLNPAFFPSVCLFLSAYSLTSLPVWTSHLNYERETFLSESAFSLSLEYNGKNLLAIFGHPKSGFEQMQNYPPKNYSMIISNSFVS